MDLGLRTQEALDWQELLSVLSGYCRLDATVKWLFGELDTPGALLATTLQEVQESYQLTEEIWLLVLKSETIPISSVVDCRFALEQIERGSPLDLGDWLRVRDGIVSLRSIQRWLSKRNDVNRLVQTFGNAYIDPVVIDTLEQSFDDRGEISESYYPNLGRLRQKVEQVKKALDTEVRRLLQDDGITKHLQENYVTERNGRVVFPMKTSYQRKIGIAHASSRSGETIFVEPISLLPLSNALQETEFAIEQEIRSILQRLMLIVRPQIPSILKSFYTVVRLDLRLASALLGQHWNAIIPEVQDEGVIKLESMRHPLLIDMVDVVPNDFSLSNEKPAMVFSGPNAGGKTIALKSVGIAAKMIQLGLPIPAKRARVDFFKTVIADIGDAQTVQEGLSSFSAHLLMMNDVLETADQSSLVLLDEIGMGTDPAQGAALAQAIIEQLLEQGSKLVVTTHFTRLKAFASTDQRCSVAAMHIQNGRPTHRLQWGEVGESEAISLAQRMQLPEILIWRARSLLEQGERQLADLVSQLDRQRQDLEQQTQHLNFERDEVARIRETLDLKEQQWEQRKERLEETARQDMRLKMSALERQANQLLREIRESGHLKSAAQKVSAMKELKKELTPQAASPDPLPVDHRLRVGDKVLVIMLDTDGIVQSMNGKRVQVNVNGMTMKMTRGDLALPRVSNTSTPVQQERLSPIVQTTATQDTLNRTVLRIDENTCDLRGVRVEEAFSILETYFDKQILNGRRLVFVLHGHGTGALRQGVRGWLSGCHYVSNWRRAKVDEGGDAFTLVELK